MGFPFIVVALRSFVDNFLFAFFASFALFADKVFDPVFSTRDSSINTGSLTGQHIKIYRNKMAKTACQNKHMKNSVIKFYSFYAI